MADNQFSNESVSAAEDLLAEMKQRANDAEQKGDVFMHSVMVDLVKVASPIVTRAIARLHREELAKLNATRKELRQKARS